MSGAITADRVTEVYLQLRDKRAADKKTYEDADKLLVEKMDKLEIWMLKQLDTLGLTEMSTTSGSVYISSRDRASCADWGTFWAWISEQGRLDMLEKRVATKTISDFLAETGQLPPAININRERSVTVRRK